MPLLAICAAAWGWALIEYWLRLWLKGETMMRHEYLKTTHEQEARGFQVKRQLSGRSGVRVYPDDEHKEGEVFRVQEPGVAEAPACSLPL